MKKELPYKVPLNYFDDLENKILSQIEQNEVKPNSKNKFTILKLFPYGIAASLLIGFFIFYNKYETKKTEDKVADMIYETYFNEPVFEEEEYLLVDNFWL